MKDATFDVIPGTRAGVVSAQIDGRYVRRACVRCGRRRIVRPERHTDLCSDCKLVDPHFGDRSNQGERSA